MSKKFNLNSLGIGEGMLNSKSLELKENFEIVNIPISKIKENEYNNYSINDIDELVDSIRAVGLKQNLDVMAMPDGTYKLLTGHRRFKALQILSAEDDKYSFVPCSVTELSQVKLPVSDESKEKYLIHITNSTQRSMTESDRFNQYNDLVKIYQEAKENGFALSDKMRNLIANDMNVSAAQVGKLDYIRNNASEELKERINQNQVSISEASEIAHYDKNEQATLKTRKKRIIDTLTEDSYNIASEIFEPLTKKYAAFTHDLKSNSGKDISKKNYAKLLESSQKIEKELSNIEKIINE
jgi:ParB family chromosome partitioning protein